MTGGMLARIKKVSLFSPREFKERNLTYEAYPYQKDAFLKMYALTKPSAAIKMCFYDFTSCHLHFVHAAACQGYIIFSCEALS